MSRLSWHRAGPKLDKGKKGKGVDSVTQTFTQKVKKTDVCLSVCLCLTLTGGGKGVWGFITLADTI